jgi:NAD(P)H-nitrite reductase large subunit
MKDPEELICICMDVRRGEIREAIIAGNLKTIEEIGEATEAGTNCGGCHSDLKEMLKKSINADC